MKIIGITGGIASGKTTISNFLKKQKFPVHESDIVVNKIYYKPKKSFINHLKKIGLGEALKGKKINKLKIRESIFANKQKKKLLEKYIHKEVKKSRNAFLKKNKNSKIVFLDIPLLFENRLEKVCDLIILAYSPINIRKKRAIQRGGMTKKILTKIIKSQTTDKIKKKKSHFIINTNKRKTKSFHEIKNIIKLILSQNA